MTTPPQVLNKQLFTPVDSKNVFCCGHSDLRCRLIKRQSNKKVTKLKRFKSNQTP